MEHNNRFVIMFTFFAGALFGLAFGAIQNTPMTDYKIIACMMLGVGLLAGTDFSGLYEKIKALRNDSNT